MRIRITSLLVDDQQKALSFYTNVLGFVKKTDVPLGNHSWLTVVAPDEQDGVELLLEPIEFEPARTYQKALFEAGIPLVSFQVDSVEQEHTRLVQAGVVFSVPPTQFGPALVAVFQDTCGNNVQLTQLI